MLIKKKVRESIPNYGESTFNPHADFTWTFYVMIDATIIDIFFRYLIVLVVVITTSQSLSHHI